MTNRPLRVFLCHSSDDKPAVRDLYEKLTAYGIDAWLDEKKLLPGQQWKIEIPKAVREADAVIICLSKSFITKEGYVQREMKFALDIALEKPEGTIYLIPARLENCKVPDSLNNWHWANLFEAQGMDYLFKSLEVRANSLNLTLASESVRKRLEHQNQAHLLESELDVKGKHLQRREDEFAKAMDAISQSLSNGYPMNLTVVKTMTDLVNALREEINDKQNLAPETTQAKTSTYGDKLTFSNGMEFMRVPAGKFLMGKEEYDNEKPQHTVDISYDYWMARYPVTNEQYNVYIQAKAKNHPVSDWRKKKDHPVIMVSWDTVVEYCKWLNTLLKAELPLGMRVRLPTEAEWEKAARGTDGREYPWGNTFDKDKCNSNESRKVGTTPVGMYSPQGDSPYGCTDMAGNVWEWTHSEDKAYPYDERDGREYEENGVFRVLRGGYFDSYSRGVRCAHRFRNYQGLTNDYIGFRIVVSVVI
jgi:formylglycine-generating enzyme required for sulfatase activity